MDKVILEIKKEEAQKLLEYIQAVRQKGLDLEGYIEQEFDRIYQGVTVIQEMAQEINGIIYEGLSNRNI